ncbi:MAG: hypothetical protein JNL93_00970 [Pelomonas sp.]|nr:hypothetical protein [Roseateles sp.]
MTNKHEFDSEGFYAALERTRDQRRATWKEVSVATGVSQTTLTRMGQGRKPDASSMAALSAWAGINPANYVAGQFQTPAAGQTLEQVALLFRQDAALSPGARRQLEAIVETAYNTLKKGSPGDAPSE